MRKTKIMPRSLRGASLVMATVLVVSMVVVISVASYATIASSRGESTYTTCATTTSVFVPQNLTLNLPNDVCNHKVLLNGFSIAASGTSVSVRGTITFESNSPLTTLLLFFNGTYVTSNPFPPTNETSFSTTYGASFNANAPVISGQSYSVEFIALFQDGTATVNSTMLKAP
ncbi:MAG: hypothetical protein JRN20_04480 [Nitrososphaerota archaeon]|jgi:hypothetical protein|nr:hypothetical protein [Nitrososphaerota archaeon]MDG6922411.1 hypothetical protein [Nitrososphaerota archaeon]